MSNNLTWLGVAAVFTLLGVTIGAEIIVISMLLERSEPIGLEDLPSVLAAMVTAPLLGLYLAWGPAVATGLAAAVLHRVTRHRVLYVGLCVTAGAASTVAWQWWRGMRFDHGQQLAEWGFLCALGAAAAFVCAVFTIPRPGKIERP